MQTLTGDSTLFIRETSSMHLPCILSRCDAAEGFTDDDVGGGRDCTSGIAHGSDVRQDNEIRRCSCASAPPLFHSDTYWKRPRLYSKGYRLYVGIQEGSSSQIKSVETPYRQR